MTADNVDDDNDVREAVDIGTLVVLVPVIAVVLVLGSEMSLAVVKELTSSADCVVECSTGSAGDMLVFGEITPAVVILGTTLDVVDELILVAVDVATISTNVSFIVDSGVNVDVIYETSGCTEVETLYLLLKFVGESRLDSVDRSCSVVLLRGSDETVVKFNISVTV